MMQQSYTDFNINRRPMVGHATRYIRDLLLTWRQTGNTTVLMGIAKFNTPFILLASDKRYGESLKKKYNLRKEDAYVISYGELSFMPFSEVDGRPAMPMMIDTSFLLRFIEETDRDIQSIMSQHDGMYSLFMDIQKELDKSKDYKLIQWQEMKINSLVSIIDRKCLLLEEQPYFLVPLTLFLSFYFLMVVYLLTCFISH